MRTIHFHKTKCGVDLFINLGTFKEFVGDFFTDEIHNTDFFEIIFFKKAKGQLKVGTENIQLQNNSVVFISPFEYRQWNVDPQDIDAHYLIFREDFLNDFFADKFFSYKLLYFYQHAQQKWIDITAQFLEKTLATIQEIKHELVHPKYDSAHIIRSLLYYLLMKLNRNYAETYNLSTKAPTETYGYQFKQLLEREIHTKQRVEDYADLMGISRISLNNAVKSAFNQTASQILKQRLLHEIQNMLLFSSSTISEISNKLNFSESHHLTRFFKNAVGATPAQYRSLEGNV